MIITIWTSQNFDNKDTPHGLPALDNTHYFPNVKFYIKPININTVSDTCAGALTMQNGSNHLLNTRNNVQDNSLQSNLVQLGGGGGGGGEETSKREFGSVCRSGVITPTVVLFWVDFNSHKTHMLLINLRDM